MNSLVESILRGPLSDRSNATLVVVSLSFHNHVEVSLVQIYSRYYSDALEFTDKPPELSMAENNVCQLLGCCSFGLGILTTIISSIDHALVAFSSSNSLLATANCAILVSNVGHRLSTRERSPCKSQ